MNLIKFLAWLILVASFGEARGKASTVDLGRIAREVKIEPFEIKSADVFDCAAAFQGAMARTLLPGDVLGENVLMSFGVAVCAQREELPQKNARFEAATIEEITRKISELYSIKVFVDDSLIVFSTQDLSLPLAGRTRVFEDGELWGWWFPIGLRAPDFDFRKNACRDYLRGLFDEFHPSLGEVEIVAGNLPERLKDKRIGYWGKWRCAEFFLLYNQYMGTKIHVSRRTILHFGD